MKPKLSILVCRMPQRYKMWDKLYAEFLRQRLPYGKQVQILDDDRTWITIGQKRNSLLNDAKGEYVCFCDDDDWISPNYIERLMEAIEAGCQCASLKGLYSVDGIDAGIFEHSLKYKEWRTNPDDAEIKYIRTPNHLNMIRSSIAKQFSFPEKNHGEDFDWSTQIHLSGLLKTEYYIPEIIYYYNYVTNKKQDMSYSQGSEDLFIAEYFSDKPNGKFIDIGAYDVFRFSNTRKLYDIGWRGILVEPAPANFKGIADHYAGEERITVLNVAIGETTGEIDFYESDGDAVSTSDLDHMKRWGDAGVKFTKIKVPQISVADFMNEYAKDADFINIDTEATNMVVFRNIPDFVFEQIKMLCIEHDAHQEEIENKLSEFGFSTIHVNAENIILGK